jgi:benzil reductase ((S)-benzoin forming)
LRTVQAEESEKGRSITCHAIAPGVVDTEMQKTIRRTPEKDFSSLERFVELHENKELKKPEVVAEMIAEMIDQGPRDEVVVSC